jgi:hypothetical protein
MSPPDPDHGPTSRTSDYTVEEIAAEVAGVMVIA